MANVLFIKANGLPAERSVSVKLYEEFLKNYKANNAADTITELDLFQADLPYYDATMMSGLFKESTGDTLTDEEQRLADIANGYLEQFLAADKVVMAFPLWNFSIPAQFLTYLFYLNQAGKTFKYTAEGPVGLVTGKEVVLLNARGGVYSDGPMASWEMSLNYVKNILAHFGITNPQSIIVEGHNATPDQAQNLIAAGVEKAAELAAKF
ncbi:FMN-dependent NADH-azoreductase [Listeria booriae]|uniref:FMN dependent NADH:quinone oxidoreductase n=1 Tax=Listeria booriae TaxID=1552123 RepID=A0A841XXN4_9LIST|nr:FMN-dependent NADH-azoreductase [Listeria booriae]MBC1230621.1 FMN-dependent NADH-azoreductase [Listeria booriae]MBC1235229.1 FMN-dependent NADH-azoreductase [Listeria booriae]MBC1247320.1 FMN-dependent NADH-azoreductase [Listeria booriae]MBC1286009.1 FMN-dependent NADH-azoreductase [Listeria booriae]MBC1291392.1 FMN-dependent NADH-azoreductase [Listeria booriae]